MEVKSITKFARISPSKVRDLARQIQGLPVADALNTMQHTRRKGAALMLKTLKSAVANAENNAKLSAENLRVREAVIECGPSLRRLRPVARGAAHIIKKRTSHIRVVLTDDND